MKFHPIDIKAADWKRLDRFADRTVFQTREWLHFVAESQNAQPVLAELRERNDVLGYFTGLTFSKFGMKVLGSSFTGWKDHHFFPSAMLIPRRGAGVALVAGASLRGSGAPIAIHWRKSAMTASGSFPVGGI